MTQITFTGAGGASMRLLNLNGRHLPTTESVDQWESVLNMKTQPDDVFICNYPKSGTHWLWEIVTMLRRRDSTPLSDHMGNYILEFQSSSKFEPQPPRVFTSHRYYDELPINATDDRCKIIFLLRDPKDICVSYYNYLIMSRPVDYEGTFGDFVQFFMDGKVAFNSWWEHVLRWSDVQEQHPDQSLLVVHYEDMKKEPKAVVRRLAKYLEVDADDTLLQKIIQNTSFDVMKKHKESLEFTSERRFKSDRPIMYRKGEVGDWKNWLTEQQGEEIRNFLKSKLEKHNLGVIESARRYFP